MENNKVPRTRSRPIHPEENEYPDECSLFVGDLARNISEKQLYEAFSQYGQVCSVDIKRDKITNNNLGYGFVQFAKRAQAAAAKANLNRQEICNRKIRIGWAQKNTNLFVFSLPHDCDTDRLREIFSAFGPICEEETTMRFGTYGYVRFKHRCHAEKAKAGLDGEFVEDLQEHPVRISWGDTNTQYNCVHVQYDLPFDKTITEQDLRDHFSDIKEATIVKVSLPRFADDSLKGYGFVHFEDSKEGEKAAALAICRKNATKIRGSISIQCNFGKKPQSKSRRLPSGGRREMYQFAHNHTLYYPMVVPWGTAIPMDINYQQMPRQMSPKMDDQNPSPTTRELNYAAPPYMSFSTRQQHPMMPMYVYQAPHPYGPSVYYDNGVSFSSAQYSPHMTQNEGVQTLKGDNSMESS